MITHPVFVIEDDPAVRDAVLTLLRSEGIMARGFSGGRDFFDRLPEVEAACVVTDVRMPDMDGLEVVRRLTDDRAPPWPVIVITGYAEVPMAIEMMKAGVVDFIEKPFDPHRLLEAVRGCLSLSTDRRRQDRYAEIAQERLDRLTDREREVFEALVEGKSNKTIALERQLSPRTVEIHRAKVMNKMQADSLSVLVRMSLHRRP